MIHDEATRALLADADRCVKCGLCLPHCPTYAETAHEGDSPRGRIALLQGLASGLIGLTESAEKHLDGCLDCRSCERVCPAQVPYGQLLDRGRAWMADARPARVRSALWLGRIFAWPRLRRLLAAGLWIYQRAGLSQLLRALPLFRRSRLGRAENLLPTLAFPRALTPRHRHGKAKPATVQLFSGCMAEWVERDAATAVIRLLEAAGHVVAVPTGQQCCGALFLHAGLPAPAQALQRMNRAAFADHLPIVSLASGCVAGLGDIERFDNSCQGGLGPQLQDPLALLTTDASLAFAPLMARVAVQVPCTQRLTPEGAAPTLAMLKRIPGVQLVTPGFSRQCCGAAGSYFLTQPAMSDRLLDETLDAIEVARADIVVSANVGCRLHLAAGLRRRGSRVEVLHPAVLLERQLLPSK